MPKQEKIMDSSAMTDEQRKVVYNWLTTGRRKLHRSSDARFEPHDEINWHYFFKATPQGIEILVDFSDAQWDIFDELFGINEDENRPDLYR